MRRGVVGLVLPVALGIAACGQEPVAPEPVVARDVPSFQKGHVEGTGLVLNSLTDVSAPLLDALGVEIGEVVIEQAVIKQFGTVEDLAGNIIGLEATGFLMLSGDALGTEVVRQEFTTGVGVISRSRGQCDIVTINLAPIALDALGGLVSVDAPAAEVTGRGNGAVGSLLCALGQALQPVVNRVTRGVRGLVNAINQILI
jgi:hypothetical protein